ncbi:hypothetical protein [Sphingomonas alpina]|uniref:hypothetical protein n=1 Tax=Sphingomonas alpina TaxID=653931 RepID=UPI001E320A33|nr:hypothetical protein [Sphingomonas alpina]
MTVVPFEPEHLADMTIQLGQPELDCDRLARGIALSATGRCFSVLPGSGGAPLFCGGALECHARYASLWAAFSPDAGPAMLAITRRTRHFLTTLKHTRVDAVVRSDFRAAHRFVHRLGMVAEARLNDYFENGGDAVVYRAAINRTGK